MNNFWEKHSLLRRISASFLIVVHFLVFSPIKEAFAYSGQSENYALNSGTINVGGNSRLSSQFALTLDTLGEPFAGSSQSYDYRVSTGFVGHTVIDDGGEPPISGRQFKLVQDMVGESFAGKTQSSNYIITAGFVYNIQSNPPVQTQIIPNQNWPWNQSHPDAFDLDDYFMSPEGFVLTYTVSGNSQINVSIASDTHLVSFSQPQGYIGTETIIFTVTDTERNSIQSNQVSLQVQGAGASNPPVLDFIEDITVFENELVTITPQATDADPGDVIAYTFTAPLDTNGQWQTDFDSAGEYTITVTATDSTGLTDSQEVTIFVRNLNRVPILDPIADITANEGELVTITPSATDPDGDAIRFYFTSPFDTEGSWLTDYDDEGQYTITVTASDETDTVSQDVLVTINNTNRPPQVTLTLSDYTVAPGQTLTIILTAFDPDSDPMTFTIQKDGQEIDSGTIVDTYTTATSFPAIGDHNISATVTDSGDLFAADTKGVDVFDPNANRDAINPVMGDFNGDSLSDLGLHNSETGTWEIAISDEGEFRNAVDWLTGFGTSRNWIPLGGDFNGDGKTDIGIYNNTNGQLQVALSDGSAFTSSGTWLTFSGASYDWQPITGNFNGDKYTDFGVYNKNSGEVRIALGNGSGFDSFSTWLNNFGTDGRILLPGDFNGDSLTDICTFKKSSGEFKVAFSTTNGFVPMPDVWISGFASNKDAFISDFNNDGFADVGYWDKSSHNWYYAISLGNRFVDKGIWLENFGTSSDETAHTGDFNGDGIVDAATFDKDAQGIDRWTVRLSQSSKVDLLVEVDNGIGGKTQITYEYAATFQNDLLPFPVYVAKTISLIDTLPVEESQEVYTQEFSYSGGWYDPVEREFRGFHKIKVTDPITQNYTETYFYQGKPEQGGALKGKIEKILAYDGNARLISEAYNTWQVQRVGADADTLGFPYLKETTATVYEENASSITTKNTFGYDNIGNIILTVNQGDISQTGDERTAYTTYNQAYEGGLNRPQEVILKDSQDNTLAWKKYTEYDDKGNLKTEEIRLNNPLTGQEEWLPTYYDYDSFGNLILTTNVKGSIVSTDYETVMYTFPERVTNSLGHQITYEYNTKFGAVTKVTDANGNSTQTQYDSLARVMYTKNAYNQIVTTYSYPDFNTKVTTQLNLISTAYIDGLGRAYKSVSQGEDGPNPRNVVSEVFYNNRGLKGHESLPHYEGEPQNSISYVRYEYDLRGRVKKTISDFPGVLKDAQASVDYITPFYTETTNSRGVRKGVLKDVYGNNVKITEFTRQGVYHTYYDYDAQDNLVKTTDNEGNIIQIWYDSLGRKIKMDDPDMGIWSYEYDEVGNLIKQTDAKNQVLEFDYDIINRLERKYTTTTTLVTYHYDDTSKDDCLGRLSKVEDQSGSTEFFYDKLGREIKSIKTVEGTAYTVERTYDLLDRLDTLKYPDGEVVQYTYDSNSGALEKVTSIASAPTNIDYVSNINYNAKGQIKTISYGNNTQTQYNYGQDLRLQRIHTTSNSETVNLQDLNYIFDKNGNVETLTDNLTSNIREFDYDDLDRLTNAGNIPTQGGGYTDFNYQYNSIGNMIYKSDVGVMDYGFNAGPHAVTSAGGYNYQYDGNGNMITGKNKTLDYDIENRLIQVSQVSGAVTTFVYDGDGGRVRKQTTNAGETQTTTYIGSLYELSSDGTITKHIYAGLNKACSLKSDGTVSYYHSDHLGSSNVMSDKDGNKVASYEYQPYGKVSQQTGTDLTNYKFTGKELDSTGLYFYSTRYYDPEIGRFITPDTIVQAPYDPQTLNRYTYVRNNPLKYIDSSGHWFWEIIRIIIVMIIGWALDQIPNSDVNAGGRVDIPFGPGGSPSQPSTSDSSGYQPPSSYSGGDSSPAGQSVGSYQSSVDIFLASFAGDASKYNKTAFVSESPTERLVATSPEDILGILNTGQAEGGAEGIIKAAEKVAFANKFRMRTIAGGSIGFFLGGEFTTFEIEHMPTKKRQYYSYFGGGASFGIVAGGSGPSGWSEFETKSYGLTEQSFHGYAILKSTSAKAIGGVGGFVIDWISGPARNERASGAGLESGVALNVSAMHGVMFRR